MKKIKEDFSIAGIDVRPGDRVRHTFDIGALYDFTDIGIPIEIIRGKKSGPTLFISAAIHGDEINGVEIVRRLLKKKIIKEIRGTLVAIPIVNVFGFNNRSRYLPDRRDLNRSFPGSKNGSLAARMASVFTQEILKKCTHGIDLHTGAIHRTNLPQVRISAKSTVANSMAESFGVPLILKSSHRDGSMREMAAKLKVPVIVFEGGEALRFNESIIKIGVNGCLSVMRMLGMLPKQKKLERSESFVAKSSSWIRAPHGGILKANIRIGERIEKGQLLGIVSDPFDRQRENIISNHTGMIIGQTTLPLVTKGDAVFHIATVESSRYRHDFIELDEMGE